MQPQRFRKKPVEVEAVRWDDDSSLADLKHFGARTDPVGVLDDGSVHIWNDAESQWLNVRKGDWIIKGVAGEFYPCEADIFAVTHEPVDA